mmetsp:Transcript_17125/g.22280  ORF Transcript_17125/g.22280 Transcript_17125/m.22280 type:complete len:501 (+) Transcript_17125:130-1632(+)
MRVSSCAISTAALVAICLVERGVAFAPSVKLVQPALSSPSSLPTPFSVRSLKQQQWLQPSRLGKKATLLRESAAAAAPLEEGGELPKGGGTASISAEIFNLIKGIVGAGVLTLPSGIAAFGNAPSAAIPAVALIGIIGALSSYGFGLIGRACALTGTTSYDSAWRASVGENSDWIPAWSVTLKTVFASLAYTMILKDTFYSLVVAAGYNFSKTTVLLGITSTMLFPLCLMKNLSSLAPFSLLGSLGMVYTAVAMFIRFADKSYQIAGRFAADMPVALQPSFGAVGAAGAFTASASILVGMLSTAYMAHFNAPKFYTELKDNTIPRYLTVVNVSFAASIAIFAAMAALGFLTFGASSSGLILNNYSPKDPLMALSKIAVAVSLVFSYPLAFVGARDGMLDLLNVKNRSNSLVNTMTLGIMGSLTVAALIIPDVSFVMAFAGSTLGNALIYIFPALMFRGAIRKLPNPTKLQKFEVKAALCSAAVGLGLGAMGVVKLLQSTR